MLKNDKTFVWDSLQQKDFDILRNYLMNEPILQYPNFNEPFNLTTDASGYAVGGVLSQGPPSKDLPIAYTSRILKTTKIFDHRERMSRNYLLY